MRARAVRRLGLAFSAVLIAVPAQAQPAQVLAAFDTDGDGQVSRQEYSGGSARELMRYDRNGDGRLTRAELPALAKLPGVRGLLSRIWRTYDASGDGVITREEVLSRGDLRFGELDANRDGYLTRNEFAAARREGQAAGR